MFVNGRLRSAERPTDRAVKSSFCVLLSIRPLPSVRWCAHVPGTGGYKNLRVALGRGPGDELGHGPDVL
jgi:hypothetical protein